VAPFLRRMWFGVNIELKQLQTATLLGGVTERVHGWWGGQEGL
jgi:hypothetical protein